MTAHVAVVGGRGKTGRAVMEAVYVIAPNMHPDEPAFVRDILTAAHDVGISRIVYHSVAAPYLPEMPHHLAKAESERLFRASGADWTILQPCAYVQNFVPALSEAEPALVVPYDPDRTFGLVDLADVGEAAASALTGAGPDGRALVGSSIELGGPARISVRDVARAAGSVLGRDVPVRRITSSEWAAGPGAGLEAREREWLVRMFDYYDDHGLVCGPVGSQAVLGRPPLSVSDILRRELG